MAGRVFPGQETQQSAAEIRQRISSEEATHRTSGGDPQLRAAG